MEILRFGDFRSFLQECIPETRPLFAEMAEEEAEHAGEMCNQRDAMPAGAYEIMSEIFWWGIFEPALRDGNERLLATCYGTVEDILRRGDEDLVTCLEIRVVEWLSSAEWINTSKQRGGPILRGLLPPPIRSSIQPESST
ncbi:MULTISPECIES: hypothetical protein [unclassified Nonomuraea]|uniref:hypothetical protein n=1 Tax=unclassified Nonomuraea TaxID=2593643 RepID=UPI0033D7BD66